MKRILVILVVIAIIIAGRGIMGNKETNTNDTTYKKISAEDAKVIMDSEDVIILDVRTQEEYNGGHIENALLLPVTDIKDKADEILADKDAKILVYCRSGNRSAAASKELISMGYTNVYDFGGISSWPYDLVK